MYKSFTMTLLRKYYDTGIEGGGIPDEVREKLNIIGCREFNNIVDSDLVLSKSILRGLEKCAHDGYLLASEELARLKEENERLRGEDDPFSLHDVLKRLSGTTKYLLDKKDYDGPDYEELEICILRAKEIIRELETTPSPTKK